MSTEVFFTTCKKESKSLKPSFSKSLKSSTYQGSCEWYGLSNKAVQSFVIFSKP